MIKDKPCPIKQRAQKLQRAINRTRGNNNRFIENLRLDNGLYPDYIKCKKIYETCRQAEKALCSLAIALENYIIQE